jgi:hypothetical protein
MALGTAVLDKAVVTGAGKGPTRTDLIHFPGDGAYPTGGTGGFEAYVKDALGLEGSFDLVGIVPQDCGAYTVVYDRTNDKLKAIVLATGVEVAAATNLAATTFNVIVILS